MHAMQRMLKPPPLLILSADNVFPALGLTVGSEVGTEARNGFQSGAPAGMRVAPHPGWEAIPLSPSDMAPITKIREELHKSDVEQAADPEEAGKREGTEGSMMGQEIEDEHKDNKKIDDEGDHASKGSEEAATALTFERPTPPDMSSLLSFIDSREEHRQSDAGAEVSMAPGLLEHLQSRGGGEQPAAQRGGESRDVGEEETSPGGKVSRDSKEGVERATVVPTEGSKREESRNSGAEEMDDRCEILITCRMCDFCISTQIRRLVVSE